MSTASTLTPEPPESPVNPAHPTASALSPALSADERRSLRRAVSLLNLDRSRFILAVVAGTAGMASAVALSGVAAWLIARASQMPDVVALGVAPVAVRLFGISRSVLRYCERLISHDTALKGMGALRTRLYEALASARSDTVAGLRRGDVLARVGSDIDAVGDLDSSTGQPASSWPSVCCCPGWGRLWPRSARPGSPSRRVRGSPPSCPPRCSQPLRAPRS